MRSHHVLINYQKSFQSFLNFRCLSYNYIQQKSIHKKLLNCNLNSSKLNIHSNIIFQYPNKYYFSSDSSKSSPDNKTIKKQQSINQSDSQQSQQKVIQITHQQYLQMKQILQTMKKQLAEIQSNNSDSKKSNAHSSDHYQKKLLEKQTNNQNGELFFDSQQQKLSLKLMQIHAKQQLSGLFQQYLQKFNKDSIDQRKENLNLLYLIFYRFCLLQGKFYDQSIHEIVLLICKNIELLDENQVISMLNIINDHMKQAQSIQNTQHFSSIKLAQFCQQIKHILIEQDRIKKVFSSQKRNSQLIAALYYLFNEPKYNQYMLKHFTLEKNSLNQKIMIYNPLNLSYQVIRNPQKSQIFELFLQSLKVNYGDALTNEYQLQQPLKNKDKSQLMQFQFEGIIYFIENYQSTKMNFITEFLTNQTMTKIIEHFLPIQQLRFYYAILIRPNALLQQKNFQLINKSIEQFLINHSDSLELFQLSKNNFETNIPSQSQNSQFYHLKKVCMLLNQLSIQLYKNQREYPSFINSFSLIKSAKNIIIQSIQMINKICLEMIELKDIFLKKSQQDQELKDKNLIMDLTLFQFTVNYNIISKWLIKLHQKSQEYVPSNVSYDQTHENINQLLKKLILLHFVDTKQMIYNGLSKDEKLQLAQNSLMMLLISKQLSSKNVFEFLIKQNLIFYQQSGQSQQKYCLALFNETILRNPQHKYYNLAKQLLKQAQQIVKK